MINIEKNAPLAPMSSFKIGGNADFYAEVKTVSELKEALKFAKENRLDFYVLGGGTNVLFSDKGFSGLIIRIRNERVKIEGNEVTAGAGASLLGIVNAVAEAGLAGLESLAGIPGTLGGAVRGNAGAYGSEISERIKSISVFDAKTSQEKEYGKEESEFGYRKSIFKKNKHLIIVSVSFVLEKGNSEELLQKVKELLSKRNSSGLYGLKSAGSFFMNPEVSDEKLRSEFEKDTGQRLRGSTIPAGWLIERAGLCGKKIGGAAVSEKHGNFLINADNATAENVIILASFIKQQIRSKFGVQLQEEVNYVGF
ncbi:MAG TPA: UDP-N-acetylmuramate dehydrogenase [Candidatus Moranbacteria bacterium]|jgi:UDP-N-acetylmuramate dehydrogenase|nr:UDP-N-acetylmuramate dehydrogenase [Candidatus Moranbacteria bacterium]HPX94012.1 UDP-N-acetylmuramate dehydrogenase [Candidatus Moranbacteria bacterium]HQB59261.1 UDP-N-acetylmuramate dehydrogenase [Candidatus Moranbacteria bacterium]